jgi:hypothetical protein
MSESPKSFDSEVARIKEERSHKPNGIWLELSQLFCKELNYSILTSDQPISPTNLGGYKVVDCSTGQTVIGHNFELSATDLADELVFKHARKTEVPENEEPEEVEPPEEVTLRTRLLDSKLLKSKPAMYVRYLLKRYTIRRQFGSKYAEHLKRFAKEQAARQKFRLLRHPGPISMTNYGGYRIIQLNDFRIVFAGENYDLSITDVLEMLRLLEYIPGHSAPTLPI